jgi:hypothetical protein
VRRDAPGSRPGLRTEDEERQDYAGHRECSTGLYRAAPPVRRGGKEPLLFQPLFKPRSSVEEWNERGTRQDDPDLNLDKLTPVHPNAHGHLFEPVEDGGVHTWPG